MKNLLNLNAKFTLLIFIFLSISYVDAQQDIFDLMNRTDLKIDQVEKLANKYFDSVGRGQGSGDKHYQRWLYERKFHLDDNGYYIRPEQEDKAYYSSVNKMNRSRALMSWQELGPKSWTYTSGWNPGVGRLTSVAIHPSDENIIYVTSPGGGIWKSINGGFSWTPLIDFINSSWMNLFNIVIDPNNVNVLYASLSSGGVLKSSDAGVSWALTGTGPSGARQIKVHPGNSTIVFCAALNGLWRSTNSGASWTLVQSQTKEDIEFKPNDPNIMYASGSSGTSCVWRSSDNGVSWSAIGTANGITNVGRTLIAVSPNDPNVVYAVQANGSIFGRMYKSTDAGLNYTTTVIGNPSSGTNYFGYEPTGTGTSGQATYDMAICVNPANANEVHIGGIICWKSINGGTSFTATTIWSYPNGTGYNHADVHSLEWINSTIYSTSDGGIYKSTNNAGDWTDLSSGIGIRQFYRISCAKTDASVITTGAQDNGSTYRKNNGAWVDWLGADGMDNIISPTNAAIAIGTSQYGNIYKTINAGTSYSNLSRPAAGNWVTPLVMHPTSHDTVYGGWNGVYRSVNGGSAWTNLSTGAISANLDVLAVAPGNTSYIYASTSTTMYRTSNSGGTWTSVTAPSAITSIFVSKNDPNKIWITCNNTSNRVFVSTDAGTTWTNISAGLPAIAARSIVVDEDASNTIYVGMNIGVYYRDDNNNTWTEHGTDLPLVAINEVEIQKSGGKLRVATYGRGVWESNLQNLTFVCSAPSSISTSNITNNSATLNWNAASGATGYDVDYKLATSNTWTNLLSNTNVTSYNLTGLTQLTTYDWRVRSRCNGDTSNYAQITFITLASCSHPANTQVVSSTSGSVNLAWAAVSTALSYTVEYKLTTTGIWTIAPNTNVPNILINGLIPGLYDWRVKANCSSGSSNYTQSSFLISCSSNGLNTSAGYIDFVGLGSISRTSGSDAGYYNGSSISTNLTKGAQYTLTFSPGYSGNKKNTFWSAYIDYNRDGDFADANELLGQKTFKNTTNTTLIFTVPSAASTGLSRIRIVMSTTAYQSSCSSYSSGETEDYSVNLLAGAEQEIENMNESSSVSVFKVYPNPSSGEIYLQYSITTDQYSAELRIFDFQGRRVLGTRLDNTIGNHNVPLDIDVLNNGQYLIQFINGDKIVNKNITILK